MRYHPRIPRLQPAGVCQLNLDEYRMAPIKIKKKNIRLTPGRYNLQKKASRK